MTDTTDAAAPPSRHPFLLARARSSFADLDGVGDGRSDATALSATYLRARIGHWLRDQGEQVRAPEMDELGRTTATLDAGALAAREASRTAPPSISALEIMRDVLVFVPVALTWWHLAFAFRGYAEYVDEAEKAKEEAQPFLVAWQKGDTDSALFSTVAAEVVASVALVAVVALIAAWRRRAAEAKAKAAVAGVVEVLDEAQVVVALIEVAHRPEPAAVDDAAHRATRTASALVAVDGRIAGMVQDMSRAAKDMTAAASTLSKSVDDIRVDVAKVVDRTSTEDRAVTAARDATTAAASAASAAAEAAAVSAEAAQVVGTLDATINDMVVQWRETRKLEFEKMQQINASVSTFGDLLETADAFAGRLATLHPDLYTCRRCSAALAEDTSGANGHRHDGDGSS